MAQKIGPGTLAGDTGQRKISISDLTDTDSICKSAPTEKIQRRGIYRKREQRAAALALPPAWEIGNRESFYAARARAQRAIMGDLSLTRRDVAVLAVCLDHMNPNERWSCFASIGLISGELGASTSGCWRAIFKADGKHILTKRSKRSAGSQYAATHITLHPNYIADLRPTSGNKIAGLKKLDRNPAKTRSQDCEENLYKEPSYKEPSLSENDYWEDKEKRERQRLRIANGFRTLGESLKGVGREERAGVISPTLPTPDAEKISNPDSPPGTTVH